MELSSSSIIKILIFSHKKAFLIFEETENQKNFLYFSRELPRSKNKNKPALKKCIISWEMELSSSKLKKHLVCQERTCKV